MKRKIAVGEYYRHCKKKKTALIDVTTILFSNDIYAAFNLGTLHTYL